MDTNIKVGDITMNNVGNMPLDIYQYYLLDVYDIDFPWIYLFVFNGYGYHNGGGFGHGYGYRYGNGFGLI